MEFVIRAAVPGDMAVLREVFRRSWWSRCGEEQTRFGPAPRMRLELGVVGT
jgi:hypothetical protein